MQGKRIIGLNWKKTDAPTVGVWIRTVAQCTAMERTTYFVYQKQIGYTVYEDIWNLFNQFIKKAN